MENESTEINASDAVAAPVDGVVMPNKLSFALDVRGSEGITMEEGCRTGDMTQSGLGICTVYYAGNGVFGGCIDRKQTRDMRDFLNEVIAKWDAEE